jgi:hypothetical protein
MGMRAGFTVLVVAGLASTSARPCSLRLVGPAERVMLRPPATGAPTNLALFAAPPGADVVVDVQAEGGEPERLTFAADDDNAGRLTLAPNTAYTIAIEQERVAFGFVTGQGDDTEPPPAPGVRGVVEEIPPYIAFGDSCDDGFIDAQGARTSVTVGVTLVEAVAAARVDGGGDIIELSPGGSFSFGSVAVADGSKFVTFDAAGNRSPVVEAVVDDAGGCAQTSTSTAMALSLVALVLARRRR